MSQNWQAILLALLAAALAGIGQALANGTIPLPAQWAWVVPALVAIIAAVSPQLKPKQ